MSFDIHRLDKLDFGGEEAERVYEEYERELMELFAHSPEGQTRLEQDPEMGFYCARLVDLGYRHIGVTLPQMTVSQVEEIVTDLFPRKIFLLSPEEADDAIPELVAFWEYLKREYHLFQVDAILKFLRRIEPEFRGMMNDPSRFGMAKSFFMAGRQAGVDMSDKDEVEKFMMQYNASIMSQRPRLLPPLPPLPAEDWEEVAYEGPRSSPSRAAREKKKNLRKMARQSRKKNKKKRR